MTACLHHLEWFRLQQRLDDALSTPLMRAALHEDFWPRSSDPTTVQAWLTEQDGLEVALRWHPELRIGSLLERVESLEEPLARAARGVSLEPADLFAVGELAGVLVGLSPVVARPDPSVWERTTPQDRERHDHLVEALQGLVAQPELAADLGRAIALEGPEGEPVVADRASPALARARGQVRAARKTLIRGAERLVKSSTLGDALADRYWTEREGRVVLPVRSSGFSRANSPGTVSGIIHGASTTGHTLFVEPSALVDDNNRLREAQMAARAEERRVLAELSKRVGGLQQPLRDGLLALGRLDVIRARLLVGGLVEGQRPVVVDPSDDDACIDLPAARHPSLMLAGTDVVPNDLRVRVGGGLIVSGPNAGGKTVALKTIGLSVLMASAGLRVPTSEPGTVPLFRRVVTDVGDDQSLAANLSTFSAHIGHVNEALRCADEDPRGTLVLLDEVAVGTDPEQGAALAEAIVCRLVEQGATVIVTTHYERLKLLATRQGAERSAGFDNAAVGFDLANLRPTFELRMGVPGSSSAIAVARRLGVPGAVLREAESMLSDERRRVDVLLQALEAERVALAEQREAIQAERLELAAATRRLEARERKEEEQAQHQRTRAHEQATRELRELEGEIRRRRKQLKKSPVVEAPDGQVAPADATARDYAKQARAAVGKHATASAPAPGQAPDGVAVGDRVFVETLGAEGQVLSVKGDRVTVQLPLAKTTVKRSALRARARPKAARRAAPLPPRSRASRHFGADAQPVSTRFENHFDLRGERADDAVVRLESCLSRAIGDDQEVVIIQHGHGSGALRSVIREHLGRLPHVAKHRGGLPPEGGDAVTVVWIKG